MNAPPNGTMDNPAMPPPPPQEPLPGQVPPPAYPGPPVQSQPLQPGYSAYQPPPPNYQQQQQQQQQQHMMTTAVVVTQQPARAVHVAAVRFGDLPVAMACPNCRNQITTSVTKETGAMVWLMIGIICLLGFWMGCCLIPLCIPSFHDSVHSCPVCRSRLGACKKL